MYLAPPGHVDTLLAELGPDARPIADRLVEGPAPSGPYGAGHAVQREPAWAANVWYEPVRIPFDSVNDAARRLGHIQRNWVLYSVAHHRRAALIADRLPHVSAKPLSFPCAPPDAALGSWTLLDRHTLLAAPACSSPFPHGEPRFVEDRTGPPNRAYLKLWEAFARLRRHPGEGERCLDLGASPGGWTWVCAQLGARVLAVDKAPLRPEVARLEHVTQRRQSAFALSPEEVEAVDWWLCDIACYPPRSLQLARAWRDRAAARNLVCTLKFQHATDHDTARAFARLGGHLMHLAHNRHELTWVWLG